MAKKVTFVKPKKIWTKKFSTEEISAIWNAFMEASPVENWENKSVVKYMKESSIQICHPETDKYDDTEGVQPEQIKKFLEFYSIEDLKKLISFLNELARNYQNNFLSRYVSDGFISWENLFPNVIEGYYEKATSIELLIGKVYVNYIAAPFPTGLNYGLENDILHKIGEDLSFFDQIKEAILLIKPEKRNLNLKDIDLENFFNERKALWKKKKGFTPSVKAMLLVNPDNFDKQVLPVIEKVFGTKQIIKLQPTEQQEASALINSFGINLLSIDPDILKRDKNLMIGVNNSSSIKDFRKAVKKIASIGNLIQIHSMLMLFHENGDFAKSIEKKSTINKEDIDILFFIGNAIRLTRTKKDKEKLLSLDFYFWKVLKRYGVNGVDHILRLVNLYEANKDNNCTIPLIKGKVGSYEYEMLPKNSPLGLILGYATDCCQVINNQGESCLYAGYEQENSTFFVVKKKGRIYAQSWVWEKETELGKKVLCFDSIEVLGKDLDKSKSILESYQEASKQLIEEGYDIVFAGADGNTMPKGMDNLGDFYDYDFIEEHDLFMPFRNTYTDINNGIIIIKEK